MHDLVNSLSFTQSLMPQTIQGSALDSGSIDMQGCDTLAVALLVGNIADTLDAAHRIDVKIEHADDDGTGAPGAYAACTDADVLNFANLSAGKFLSIDGSAKKQKRYVIGYTGGLRFVKVTATPVSLSTGGAIAMLALKGALHQTPAVNG